MDGRVLAATTGHSAGASAIAIGTTADAATATAATEAQEAEASGLALFRLALEEGDQGAWEAIVSRYRNLVLDWTRRSLRAPIPREHEEDWVTRAFERFWLAVGPEGSRFRDLPAALQYLKLCVRSVVLDDVRARRAVDLEPLEDLDERRITGRPGAARSAPDVESVVFDRMGSRDLWQTILETLSDSDERLVIYLSFVQGMKPAEIATSQSGAFASTADVYRIKRNAIERLRRAPRLLARLGSEAFTPQGPLALAA
jgi:RNA polymerase sigma factor (sigma-70 family)